MQRYPLLFLILTASTMAARAQAPLSLAEAVAGALQQNPAIQIQQAQTRASAGAVTQARAPFDNLLTAGLGAQRDQRLLRADELLKFPSVGAEQLVRSDSFRLGVDRLLESGPQLGTAYSYSAANDNVQGAQNIPLQASDRLSFSLRLPLQRSPAREAAAGLAAAEAEARAARMDSEHTIASTVLAVAQGYWDWAGRLGGLSAARTAEERVAKLVEQTEKLVQLDELPPAELNLVRASAFERTAARVAAEQRQVEARNSLGRLLGMNAGEASQLSAPADPLPQQSRMPPSLTGLRATALASRRDLDALRLRESASQSRLEAAKSSLRPQTDLVLSGYYAGLREGGRRAGALPLNTLSTGPGIAASLVYQFPVENSAGSGLLNTAYANLDAARLRRKSLEDAITVSLDQAHAALAAIAAQLELSRDIVERYRTTVKNEETKRLLGSATLIDVLNIEDRLNNALIARLQYQQAYAAALAQLLFEAGQLVKGGEDDKYSVDFKQLMP